MQLRVVEHHDAASACVDEVREHEREEPREGRDDYEEDDVRSLPACPVAIDEHQLVIGAAGPCAQPHEQHGDVQQLRVDQRPLLEGAIADTMGILERAACDTILVDDARDELVSDERRHGQQHHTECVECSVTGRVGATGIFH